MTFLILLLSPICAITIPFAYIFYDKYQYQKGLVKLYRNQLAHSERQLIGERTLRRALEAQKPKYKFDKQTDDLLLFAINNGANSNEARNAAMKACKRIYKALSKQNGT